MKKFKDWVIFPGYRHKGGFVSFQAITVDHLRGVFFPRDFHETYRYLGAVPLKSKTLNNDVFYAMRPLVVYLDYLAKPWWCPRWFLRLLHLFGNDNSIIRMRNRRLHRLHKKITRGYFILDYKTKWEDYDLRISIAGGEHEWFLVDAIESGFWRRGEAAEKKVD